MPKITISYRRDDSGVIAGRIFDRLVAHYGSDTVFRDIDNIPPGIDYRKYIESALQTTNVVLAIVGPHWVGQSPGGGVRIHDRTDLVRIEVATALRRDIPVIPVLVGNATMPRPDELPDELQDLPYRNAVKVDGLEDFDDHVKRLIRSLDRLFDVSRTDGIGATAAARDTEDSSRAAPSPFLGPRPGELAKDAPKDVRSEPTAGAHRMATDRERTDPGKGAQKSYRGLAIGSLVCSILGIVVFGVILGPIAAVLGVIARKRMSASRKFEGSGLALAGIIIGSIDTALSLIFFIVNLSGAK
jgi:hypothetical protein